MTTTKKFKMINQEMDKTCFYKIRETTKDEYISIGSNGNILRWSNTGGDEQKWLIVPTDIEGNYRLYTKQNGNECMSVGDNGNILRWTDNGDKNQLFRFVNPFSKDGYTLFNIQESTKNEYVAVGSDGNILRWAATNDESQLFSLEIIDESPLPNDLEIFSNINRFKENEIPLPPSEYYSNTSPADNSEKYLIETEIISSVLINDSNITNKVLQANTHPYYHLARSRYWKKIYETRAIPDIEETIETTHRIGISHTNIKQVETTLGVSLSLEVGGSYKGVTGKLAQSVSWTKTHTETEENTQSQYIEKKTSKKIRVNEEKRIVLWQAVDAFQLYDSNGNLINSWDAYDDRIEINYSIDSSTEK